MATDRVSNFLSPVLREQCKSEEWVEWHKGKKTDTGQFRDPERDGDNFRVMSTSRVCVHTGYRDRQRSLEECIGHSSLAWTCLILAITP